MRLTANKLECIYVAYEWHVGVAHVEMIDIFLFSSSLLEEENK